MVMLSAYFDESYNHPTKKEPNIPLVYTVAGYISSVQQWQAFQVEWKEALEDADTNIKHFHMSEFESRIGIYKDWSDEKRIKFIQTLHSIIHKYVLKGFATTIILEDYENLTDNEKYVFGEPHFCAFVNNMKLIKTLCDEFNLHKPIAFILENNPHFDKKINNFFSEMSDEEKQHYRFGSLAFAEKICMPLQAADILAYEVTKETARQRNTNNTRPTRKSIQNLAVSRIDKWVYMDKRGFSDVINFIKEKGLNEGVIEL